MRKTNLFKYVLGIAAWVVVALAVIGQVVQHLWNWLVPSLFHLSAITFWQALGIVALSRIVLGHGWHPSPGRGGPWFGRGRDIDIPGGRGGWKRYAAFWKDEGRVHYEGWLGRQDKEA